MIRCGTREQAQAKRRRLALANGTGYWKSELIATSSVGPLAPQAFLIEQDPDTVILPHFHMQDEFQVVVHGGGSFGRHAVRPLTVHYAGAHTGYGPITAGPAGLWYFTLRAMMDQGAHFLPEARERMDRRVAKRHLLGAPLEVSENLAHCSAVSVEDVVAPQHDGIAAWFLRIPPGLQARAPEHPDGVGRIYLVAAGAIRHGAERLARWATVFVSAEREPFALEAGMQGAEVLALQFPRPSVTR